MSATKKKAAGKPGIINNDTSAARADSGIINNDTSGALPGGAAAVLAALLDAWREKRAPALADAIDAVAKVAARPAALDTHEAWMALALENSADDVTALVDAMLAPKLATFGGRVEQLSGRPDDPRIAMAFARAALEPPMTASSNFHVWTKMYDAMARIADVRIAPLLKKRLAQPPGDSKFWPRHYKALEKLLAGLPEAPTITAAEEERLAALVESASRLEPAARTKKKTAPAPSGDPLERAAGAAELAEWRDCLTALVEAWRPMRLAVIGDAIEHVSAILEDGRPPPTGPNLQATWLATAAKKDIADIGLLAESSSDARTADAESNMDAMATWPEDPRIARAMIIKLFAMAFGDRSRAWTLVGNLIVRNADQRFVETLPRLEEGNRTDNKARNGCLGRVVKELRPFLAKIEDRLGPVDLKNLARVNAAVDAFHRSDVRTERKFIDAILADRENDAPFLVYADWLNERNHPRGEVIVLQCAARNGSATDAQTKRLTELYSGHARAILGPAAHFSSQSLAYAISSKGVVFDRGLVDDLFVYFSPPAWTYRESPLLRTTRDLRMGARGVVAVLDLVRRLEVRSLSNATLETLAALCESERPTHLESLVAAHWLEQNVPLSSVLPRLGGKGLCNLKHFDFTWTNGRQEPPPASDFETVLPDELYAAPFLKNVVRFAFNANVGPQLASMKKHGLHVRSLNVVRPGWGGIGVDLALDDELAPLRIELTDDPQRETKVTDSTWAPIPGALRNIATVAPHGITEIRISSKIEFTDAARAELDSIAADCFAGASVQVR